VLRNLLDTYRLFLFAAKGAWYVWTTPHHLSYHRHYKQLTITWLNHLCPEQRKSAAAALNLQAAIEELFQHPNNERARAIFLQEMALFCMTYHYPLEAVEIAWSFAKEHNQV
jgi:hypothetical protein